MGRADKKFLAIKNIFSLLSNSPTIKSFVGDKIFPLVAPQDTSGDFIAVQRDGYKREDTKMGVALQVSVFFTTIVSEEYDRSLMIADAVYDALEGSHPQYEMRVKMVDYGEEYIDSKFIQVLKFNLE